MKLALKSFFLFFIIHVTVATAQDTLKIQRGAYYDKNCFLALCVDDVCYTDTIPQNVFMEDNNIELMINEGCTANKKFDIFVSSFEISSKSVDNQLSAQSSFFTDPQKQLVQKIKIKDSFVIKSIMVHAPDGFKKMNDLIIVVN